MRNISTNILRDTDKELNFIATPNSKEVFERIFIEKGTKSFNLIGNYGTGKSTFLWACEKVFRDKENLFGVEDFEIFSHDYKVVKILGEDESLIKLFARTLSLSGRINTKRVIENLELLSENNTKLVIFIDEFGKILESISTHKLSTDLYFLQQLAEWVNGQNENVYLVTTLHQNFLSYNQQASASERQEWEKIKGRYKDIVFNEPVEQLLFFASKELQSIPPDDSSKERLNDLLALSNNSKLTSFNKILSSDLIEDLYPLDWMSANILVQALQKYGQNERSLFTFVNETSRFSISKNSDEIYNIPKVYDYLVNSLSTEINSLFNSHRAQWLTTFRALERAELFFEEDYEYACKIIKTVLLINLFSKTGGLLDDKLLIDYFKFTESIDISESLSKLKSRGILRFYSHSNKLNFLEGTDIDIEQELIEAGKELSVEINYAKILKELVALDVIYVKRHSFLRGMKRFFEYRIIESLDEGLKLGANGIDGAINIISFDCQKNEVLELCKTYPNIGYVVINDSKTIELTINKILRYDILIAKHNEDKNAVKLLNQEKLHCLELLKSELSQNLFKHNNYWFFNGAEYNVNSSKDLHELLSSVCDEIYFKTPVFENELINRNVLSSPIITAKRALFNQLINNSAEKNLGYPDDKFPPDKAIFVSLIRETGLHGFNSQEGRYKFNEPNNESALFDLWSDCNQFLNSALSSKKSVSDLYDLLLDAPFKLKQGFVDFFIPIYMIVKSEDYALFYKDNTFIPFLSLDTIDLIHRKPQDFFVKAYNIQGLNINLLESYKELVGLSGARPTQSTFISIYGNFLRFIKGLDNYTLNTNKLSPSAKELRSAVMNSNDPESALFESIPIALGYGNILENPEEEKLQSFTTEIQKAIKELRGSYSELLNRIENYIITAFNLSSDDIKVYKNELIQQLSNLDEEELITAQKVLYKRLTSALDDRESYIKSIADAVIGYPVEDLKDHDESILKDRLGDFAEGLLMASKSQNFNKNSSRTKLLQFKFFNADGSVVNEKVILKSTEENFDSLLKIEDELNGLDIEKKKEILMQLYSRLIKEEVNV